MLDQIEKEWRVIYVWLNVQRIGARAGTRNKDNAIDFVITRQPKSKASIHFKKILINEQISSNLQLAPEQGDLQRQFCIDYKAASMIIFDTLR